jgi:hypothetical protein
VLDPGGYDLISVNKSISSVQAGILPSGADAVTISAGANDAVRLRGLFIEAATPGSNTGIHIVSAGSVYIDHCSIRGFATGISLESTGVTKVFVSDCEITLKHDGPDAEHDGRAFLSPVQQVAPNATARAEQSEAPAPSAGAIASAPSHEPGERHQHQAGGAGDDAVLDMHAGDAGLMPGEEARQRIRRHHEINDGNGDQGGAQNDTNGFHGGPSVGSNRARGAEAAA